MDLTRLARYETQQPMAIGQCHPVGPVRERFHYSAFDFEGVFSGHVKISAAPSVINTVCSK